MKIVDTPLPDIKLLEPKVFGDERGFFLESYNKRVFKESLGIDEEFVQANHSHSSKGVLRGLHYQLEQPQGKLIRLVTGEVFDVVVDMRSFSPTFGKAASFILSAQNKRIAWVPPGFAHGFLVLSDQADFLYQCTDYYHPQSEQCLLWSDPSLRLDWPIQHPLVSPKDSLGKLFTDCAYFNKTTRQS